MRIPFFDQVLSFSQRLFFSVITLFLAFVICFLAFQYRREKEYKVELLNTQLQYYNKQLSEFIVQQDTLDINTLRDYVRSYQQKDLRVTLI